MAVSLRQIDKVEIMTLQDNYIDLVARDNTDVVTRAMPLKGLEVSNSVLAEHGFSALATTVDGQSPKTLLFDFGFSEHGAAYNARALNVDMKQVEIMALSHGHLDHVGGFAQLAEMIDRPGIELVLHPEAFRNPRYMKITEDFKISFPPFTRENAEAAGVMVKESARPHLMLDDTALFLGEIERTTDFEKGAPALWFDRDGKSMQDTFEDDSALVFSVKGKGLVVLTGCAHSGVVNTIRYAQKITGEEQVFAVIGGFHLSGADRETVILPTIDALQQIDPAYVIPTHCTGREAINMIENAFPGRFIANMSGTKLTFQQTGKNS